MDDLQQFKDTYITECFELLEEMEGKLLELDAETASDEDLNAIFRCAHSIKGGAGAFGFNNIASFTHILEALLDKMRDHKIDISPEVVDALLRARDIVYQMVVAAQEGSALPEDYGSDIAQELGAFDPSGESSSAAETGGAKASPQEAASDKPVTYHILFAPHNTITAYTSSSLALTSWDHRSSSLSRQTGLSLRTAS